MLPLNCGPAPPAGSRHCRGQSYREKKFVAKYSQEDWEKATIAEMAEARAAISHLRGAPALCTEHSARST
eukprot:gene20320-58563_t